MTDADTTVATLRDVMRTFVAERDWHKYHTPRNLAASVCVEAGELLELFQWTTQDEAVRKTTDESDFRRAVGEEMSDVLMYLISLANSMDLDLASAVEAKMIKNRKKYPSEKFQGHYERPLQGKDEKEG
jgi:NTP pyrophosphatase (non-canonical NTP hydrolase)